MFSGKHRRQSKRPSPHGCPVMAFQAMISGKYKIRILWDLRDGPRRYSEIRTGLLSGATGTREIAPRVLEPGAESARRSRHDRAQGLRPRSAQG